MTDFSQATAPGAYITDLLPQLDRIPKWLQWWRARAYRLYKFQYALWMPLWQKLRQQINDGAAPSCFAKHFMQADVQRHQIDEIQAAFLAGSM